MRLMFIIFALFSLVTYDAIAFVNTTNKVGKLIKGKKVLSSGNKINLVANAGKISKVTQRHLSLSKPENIQNLLALAVKEKKINFTEQFSHTAMYNKLKDGDKLLLKCLKNTDCKLDKFAQVINASPLHRTLVMRTPSLTLGKTNQIVGLINEHIMNKYFISTGWKKIQGEVGRNGIDGLFIKKKNGHIVDLMIVESKYNKSGLQHTLNGKQMTKQWILKKMDELQKQYPNNKDYIEIQKLVQNDTYRSMLWHLTKDGDNLKITLKKVHDKNGKIAVSKIKGSEKMKINFTGNQEINTKKPKNDFHAQIASWYRDILTQSL